MKYKKWFVVLIIFCFSSLQAIDNIDNDFQIWLYAEAYKTINKCFDVKLSVNERRDKDATRAYFEYGQIDFNWKPSPSWIIGPIFRQAYVKQATCNNQTWWRSDSIPIFNITKLWTYCDIKISDRNWFQYSSLGRFWTYRNRVQITFPYKYSPFISNEFFWRRFNRFTQNRFQVGIETPPCGMLKLMLAYMLRSRESGNSWINQHVLVINLGAQF